MPRPGKVNLQDFCGLPKGPAGRCLPADESQFWRILGLRQDGEKVLWLLPSMVLNSHGT